MPPISRRRSLKAKLFVEESLCHLPVSSLQKLITSAATSNNKTNRIEFVAKQIFSGDFDRIDNMSKAMKLCETAINTITVIKFYENYMMKGGRLSWDT